MIQDFFNHGISIPIGSSNKFTKKLVVSKLSDWSIWTTVADCRNQWTWKLVDCKIFNDLTSPYWNDDCDLNLANLKSKGIPINATIDYYLKNCQLWSCFGKVWGLLSSNWNLKSPNIDLWSLFLMEVNFQIS